MNGRMLVVGFGKANSGSENIIGSHVTLKDSASALTPFGLLFITMKWKMTGKYANFQTKGKLA